MSPGQATCRYLIGASWTDDATGGLKDWTQIGHRWGPRIPELTHASMRVEPHSEQGDRPHLGEVLIRPGDSTGHGASSLAKTDGDSQ